MRKWSGPADNPIFNTSIAISGAPYFIMTYTSGGADQKTWDEFSVGTVLGFRAVNDAYNNATTWMQVNRGSGFSVSNVTFPNLPIYALQFNTTSDRRLKTNIRPSEYGLNALLRLKPVTFDWIAKQEGQPGHEVGLVAQDVKSIIPEAVSAQADDMKTLSISYQTLVPVLIKAIQEQQLEIELLRKEIHSRD